MTYRPLACLAALAAAMAIPVSAAPPASPYAGEERRDIKALSPEEVDAYLAGKGMALAKAAELNGFAGPAHVLELATPLGQSSEQRARTEALFASMASRARTLGRALVDEERRLDRLFADKTVTPERLTRSLDAIGALQSQLRAAHLAAHLAQVEILTAEQNERYAELRGYRGAPAQHGPGDQHKH